jgi:hypothetical protein
MAESESHAELVGYLFPTELHVAGGTPDPLSAFADVPHAVFRLDSISRATPFKRHLDFASRAIA